MHHNVINSKEELYSIGYPLEQKVSSATPILLMVCCYIFLVTERPWESIRYLQGIPLERIFAVIMLLMAFLNNRLRVVPAPTNKWVYTLLGLHFVLAPFAYLSGFAFEQGIEYLKMVVLYMLILSCCDQETDLRLVVKAFVFSTALYVLHSYWEYLNGRHTYRMYIVRMIGVGETYSDPNTFAASIVLSFPFAWALFKSEAAKWSRRICVAYGFLGVLCIVLTGSRSGTLGLLLLLMLAMLAQKGARRVKIACFLVVAVMVVWSFMPADKQERIRTVWDKNAGPANAHESTEGRSRGYHAGMTMFSANPLIGIGPGGKNFIMYRKEKVDGIAEQAHHLIGEVLGEFGAAGAIAFVGMVGCSAGLLWRTRKQEREAERGESFLCLLSGAGLTSLLLLIFLGFAGHNFYRPLWLWIAAWASLAYGFSMNTGTSAQQVNM